MHASNFKFFRSLVLQSSAIALTCLPLSATTVTWNGDAGDASVSNDANWVGGTAAPSGSDLVFGAETVHGLGLVQFDAGITFTAPSVTFTAAAPAYTLTAGGGSDILSITGSGIALTNLSAFRQTSQLITVQTATQIWNAGASGLSISAIDLQNNRALTLTGTGSGLNGTEITQKITGTGTSGIVKTGTGTLTFNNALANDYTGATTVSGGTLVMNGSNSGTGAFAVSGTSSILRLGLSDRIADTSGLTLSSGGTFDLANKNETASVLTIGAGGGVIDFGTGTNSANTLTLAASNLASWTAPLQIKNFNTGDSLRFLGAGLTPSQLANVKFITGSATNGSGFQTGAIDGSGFVTPTLAAVPEVSTFAFGTLAAFASLCSRQRRRK